MSGNGVDLGQIVAMLADVLQAQEQLRVELSGHRGEFGAFRAETYQFRAEMHKFRAETQRDLAGVKRDLAGLRQTVAEYHASVLGHGVLISELDERLRRVEAQLGLPHAV